MPKLIIDGTEIEVTQGTSVLQACEQLGIEIPRFCYHDRLSVPANCRMCLVEIEKAPKLMASCAMPAQDGQIVHTKSPAVIKGRKGVMEMLLINHPLDCPICDQGGECDLQDQAMGYGFDRSRFYEAKRAVKDKELGPLIKTAMNRCIHCTRCVRFADEIAGTPQLGATGRGEHVEIGTYIEGAIQTELSGNLADVCPVGALLMKPYAFTARPWELRKIETVDVMDAVGCNIRVDVRGGEVMRVLPRLNEEINEEWINDKTRFAYDGLKRQRLDRPYVRKDGKLVAVSWDEALQTVANRLRSTQPQKLAALAGDLVDVESTFALQRLMDTLGTPNLDCRVDGAQFDVTTPAGYLFNTTIAGIEQADAVLLIGTDLRHEATLINARLRKRARQTPLPIALVGAPVDLTYKYEHLGTTPLALEQIARGTHPFADILKNAHRPMLILGAGALQREDGLVIQSLVRRIADSYGIVKSDWNGYNMLQLAAGRTGALLSGFVPGANGRSFTQILDGCMDGSIETVFLHGVDTIDPRRLGQAFVIYQGHHGDIGAHRADVILPGAAYTEKDAIYVNTEGRPQLARQAAFPPGDAKEDWKIMRALMGALNLNAGFDNLPQLRKLIVDRVPELGAIDSITPRPWQSFADVQVEGNLSAMPLQYPLANFYMTDPISRASKVMAECTATFVTNREAEAA